MYNEDILVVPADVIEYDTFENGLACPHNLSLHDLIVHGSYLDRNVAETDETFKQIIPYCVFRNKSGLYYNYARTKKGGDARLHLKYSLGVGGHIAKMPSEPMSKLDEYEMSLYREIKEELGVDKLNLPYKDKVIGYIYDDSNEVGRVHLGVVHLIEPLQDDFNVSKFELENTIASSAFSDIKELNQRIKDFEGWSQIILNHNILC